MNDLDLSMSPDYGSDLTLSKLIVVGFFSCPFQTTTTTILNELSIMNELEYFNELVELPLYCYPQLSNL